MILAYQLRNDSAHKGHKKKRRNVVWRRFLVLSAMCMSNAHLPDDVVNATSSRLREVRPRDRGGGDGGARLIGGLLSRAG